MKSFVIRAGTRARKHLIEQGLSADDITIFPAAAGGPKWLVLGHLDRFIFGEWFKYRTTPLYTVGSSIGNFRVVCGAQNDVNLAFRNFESAYLSQQYSTQKPLPSEMTDAAKAILDSIGDKRSGYGLINHPYIKPSIVVSKCSSWFNGRFNAGSFSGLSAATVANYFSRKNLSNFYERVVFSPENYSECGFIFDPAVNSISATIDLDNSTEVLLASASIPLAMETVRDIPGVARGTYIDGGIVDYHMDISISTGKGFAFMPHFSPVQLPGWLDKFSARRSKPTAINDSMIIVHPSAEFMSSLPHAKIPDRTDLKRYNNDYGALYTGWKSAADISERIADEFSNALVTQTLHEYLSPTE